MSKVKKLIIVQYKGEWNQDAGYEVEVDEFGTKNYEKIYILKYAQGFHWTNPGKKASKNPFLTYFDPILLQQLTGLCLQSFILRPIEVDNFCRF